MNTTEDKLLQPVNVPIFISWIDNPNITLVKFVQFLNIYVLSSVNPVAFVKSMVVKLEQPSKPYTFILVNPCVNVTDSKFVASLKHNEDNSVIPDPITTSFKLPKDG